MNLRRMMMYSLGSAAPTFESLGNLVGLYKGGAPTASTNTDEHNTVSMYWGTPHITRLWDFSGKGNHLIFQDPVAIPYVGGKAVFNGNQYSEVLSIPGISAIRTIYMHTDAIPTGFWLYYTGGSSTYFGPLTGDLTDETYSTIVQNSPQDFQATDVAIPSGFKRIGHVLSASDAGVGMIYLNGGQTNLITGQKTASNLGGTFGLARNGSLTGNRMVGTMDALALYEDALPPASVAILDGLITDL